MLNNSFVPDFVKPHAPAWVARPAPELPIEGEALFALMEQLNDGERVTETLIAELPHGGVAALPGNVPYRRSVARMGGSYEVFLTNKNGEELGYWNEYSWRETTRDVIGNILTFRDSHSRWSEYTRDAAGRELTYWGCRGEWRESAYDGHQRVAFRQGESPAPFLEPMPTAPAATKPARSMAENFIAAWDRWDKVNWDQEPRHSAPIFTEWANEQGLIGDDAEEGQFLYMGVWGLMPNPDKNVLAYDVMDFEDGSIAFRRSYENEYGKEWFVGRPAGRSEQERPRCSSERG